MWAAIVAAYHAVLYDPIYNGLVFLINVVPGHDVGLAIIILTFVVRLILFPLARRAVKAQMAMKQVAPEVEKLKQKYKNDREEQSRAIFALYKERDIHPLSGVGILLIQLPVMLAVYFAARYGLPAVNVSLLYSFVHAPTDVNMEFLGLINLSGHSIVLAALAALSQFAYTRLSMGRSEKSSPVEASLSGDMAKSFEMQARYVMPLIIGVFGYSLSAAVPLYYTASNLFMIAQEYVSGRRL